MITDMSGNTCNFKTRVSQGNNFFFDKEANNFWWRKHVIVKL
jgi:hypothetical protein